MDGLLRGLDAVHPARFEQVVDARLATLPTVVVSHLLLLDVDGGLLSRYPGADRSAERHWTDTASSPAGSAVVVREPVLEPHGPGQVVVHLPLMVRAEVLGVLSVTCRGDRDDGGELPGAVTLAALLAAATDVAYALATSHRVSDHVTVGRRAHPMTLAAELQAMNLPVLAQDGEFFRVAGRILPAYQVGGDLFDVSWDDDGLWLTVADAVGHGVQSSILAFAALGSIRHARRCGAGLAEQVAEADATLVDQWDGLHYVTGVVARLGVDGTLRWVNAGHLPPMILRGGRLIGLQRRAQFAMGLLERTRYEVHETDLVGGDRLFLYSDGLPEARGVHRDGAALGAEQTSGALLATAGTTPFESVRSVLRLVEDWTACRPRDDATLLVADVMHR